jgi:hypothetical protein
MNVTQTIENNQFKSEMTLNSTIYERIRIISSVSVAIVMINVHFIHLVVIVTLLLIPIHV